MGPCSDSTQPAGGAEERVFISLEQQKKSIFGSHTEAQPDLMQNLQPVTVDPSERIVSLAQRRLNRFGFCVSVFQRRHDEDGFRGARHISVWR